MRKGKARRNLVEKSGGQNAGRDRLAISAIAISVLALLISAGSLLIQWRGYKATLEEVVAISVSPWSKSKYIKLVPFDDKNHSEGGLLEVNGDLTISNNGSRKISVTHYEVRTAKGVRSASGRRFGEGYHIGLEAGLFDLKGEQVSLPIYLEPGESKLLLARIGTMIPDEAFLRLTELGKRNPLDRKVLLEALEASGIDVHGNAVEVERDADGSVRTMKFSNGPKPVPKLVFRIRTGQGNEFWVESHWRLMM